MAVLTNPYAAPIVQVPEGNTGTIVIGRFLDEDGNALDLSAASGSVLFHASTTDGVAITTDGSASFVGDGSDGRVQYTLTATEVASARDLRCEFEVQGFAGGNRVSEMFILKVVSRAKVV